MQCLREDHCSLTSTVASKTTRVTTDSDYPLRSATRACLPLQLGREGPCNNWAGHLQPTAWMSLRTAQITSTETPSLISSWTNLCFNYSICWEVQFVSRSNNSCVMTLIEMYSLDFSAQRPASESFKETSILHTSVFWGEKKRQKKLTLSVYSLLRQLRFFLRAQKPFILNPLMFLHMSPLILFLISQLAPWILSTEWSVIVGCNTETFPPFSVLSIHPAYGYHCPFRQSATLRAHCPPTTARKKCFPGRNPPPPTLCSCKSIKSTPLVTHKHTVC